MTVGESVGSEVFFLKETKPDYVAFVCTPKSRQNIDPICQEANIQVAACCHIFEVQDDATQMPHMVSEVHAAFAWLKKKCGADAEILVNPTAGRKWMSAGLLFATAKTSHPVYYVDANFKEGQPVAGTENLVEIGNVDDFATSASDTGVELFNHYDFVGAHNIFNSLQPAGSAAARELYRGLAKIAEAFTRWERFEHYNRPDDILEQLDEGITEVDRSASELDRPLMSFLDGCQSLRMKISEVAQASKPSLVAVVDLYFNGRRRIQTGRLDDGVARLYRAFEACAQWLLSFRNINASQVDWSVVSDEEKKRFKECRGNTGSKLPAQLGLVDAAILVDCLLIDWNSIDSTTKSAFICQLEDRAGLPGNLPLTLLATPGQVRIDWSRATGQQRDQFKCSDGGLPQSLPLSEALTIEYEAIETGSRVFLTKDKEPKFAYSAKIRLRNDSILAHGWNAISEDEANRFARVVADVLEKLGADFDGWEVPKLPKLWT